MTIDSDGMIWWLTGWLASHPLESTHHRLLKTIRVPAAHVTACAFGGPKLDLLYITTPPGLDPQALTQQPHAVLYLPDPPRGLPA